MGKRNKEASVGRRRPMIQLGNSQKQGLSAVSRNNIVKDEPPETTNTVNKVIDDQLAGFLAEINSLETPTSSEPQPSTTTSTEEKEDVQQKPSNMLYDPEDFDPATQGHLIPEPWQACYDDRTMCYYYWNTITNEVQWYPPVATIPPPPPPLPSVAVENDENEENIKDEKNSETNIEETHINDEDTVVSESKTMNNVRNDDVEMKVISKDDTTERKNHTDEESVSSKKEKDKELMSQIKERIQRKKEEKLRKEKEEKQRMEEESSVVKTQQDKEESLRERLIKKKLEREKDPDSNNATGNAENILNTSSSVSNESFSVDIFAAEETRLRERKESESKEDTQTETKETVIENVIKEIPLDDISEMNNETTFDKNTTEIKKGGWRIIDAGYDDDDEDGEESDKNNEDMQIKAPEETKTEEVVGKKKDIVEENVDNYAEMLLEDAITADDKTTTTAKQDSQEAPPMPPSLPPSVPPPPPEHDERPPLPPGDEPLPEMPETSEKEEGDNRKQVGELSKELFEKLDFLGISTKDLRGLVVCYVELETRMKDWQAGALNSAYFLKKINDLSVQIIKHEESAAPPGWVCHWSSEFKMYYYHETATGNSQWQYPATAQQQQQQQQQQQVSVSMSTMPTFPTSHVLALQTQHMMMTAVAPGYAGLMMSAAMTPPMVAPAISSLVPTAQTFQQTTDSNKRPAPPETDGSTDPYRDPYRGAAKKKKEVSTFPDQVTSGESQEITISGTASPVPGKSVIAAAPLIRDASREASPALLQSSSTSNVDSDGTFSPILSKNNTAAETVQNAKAKLKKKKKVDSSGLPSKKKKQVSSLVAKWQTVKQKVEEEENVEEESEDEDFEAQSERRINEWKKEIETSGKKEYNPNFTEIKGNWRERLLQKKSTT